MIKKFKWLFARPTITSWIGTFINLGSAFLVLPLMLNLYNSNEISFWFLINTLLGFAALADSGFGSTVTRAVGYFNSGAVELPKNIEEYKNKYELAEKPNYSQLANLLSTTKVIYRYLSAFAALLLLLFGTLTLWNVLSLSHHDPRLWISFFLIIINSIITIQTTRYSSVLMGLGYVAKLNIVNMIGGVVKLTAFTLILIFKGPIYLLVCVMVGISLLTYFINRYFISDWKINNNIKKSDGGFDKHIFSSIWPATWKSGLIFWGSYFINNGNNFVIAQIKDTKLMACFLFTQRVINILRGVSQAPFYTHLPVFINSIAKKDYSATKKTFSEYTFISLFIFILGSFFILILGNPLLQFLHINAQFLPWKLTGLFLFMILLEMHHSYHSSLYVITNDIPFLWPALISGILILAMSFAISPLMGVIGIILVQFVVQLSFNNWYPVKLSLRLLRWNFFSYLKDVIYWGTSFAINQVKVLFK